MTNPDKLAGSPRRCWRDAIVGALVAVTCGAAYVASPTIRPLDPKYSALASEVLLEDASVDLAPRLPALSLERAAEARREGRRPPRFPYQLVRDGERIVHRFPYGSIALSVPVIGALRLAGWSSLGPGGRFDSTREVRLHHLAASIVTAFGALLVFLLARREVGRVDAAAVALVAGLGSAFWTVTSRALWTQCWSAVVLAAVLLELLRWEDGRERRPLALAALLVAAVAVRPPDAIHAVGVFLWVVVRHRRAATRLALGGSLGAVLLWIFWIRIWGVPWPSYVSQSRRWGETDLVARILEGLFSVENGLLVFSPILLAVAVWAVRHGVEPRRRSLATLVAGLAAAHFLLHMASGAKWGAIGPRFQADLVPWLAWLGAAVLRSRRAAAPCEGWRRWVTGASTAALVVASLLASVGGVFVLQKERKVRTHRGVAPGEVYRDPHWRWDRLPQRVGWRWLVRAAAGENAETRRRSGPAS